MTIMDRFGLKLIEDPIFVVLTEKVQGGRSIIDVNNLGSMNLA